MSSPAESEITAQMSLDAIRGLGRDAAVALAVTRSNLVWARKARRGGQLDAMVLGRFDLLDRPGHDPVPSLAVLVKTKEQLGVYPRAAVLYLHMLDDQEWRVFSREGRRGPDGELQVPVPTASQYRGHKEQGLLRGEQWKTPGQASRPGPGGGDESGSEIETEPRPLNRIGRSLAWLARKLG